MNEQDNVEDVLEEWWRLEASVPEVTYGVPLSGGPRRGRVASGRVCPCCTTHDFWLSDEKEDYRKPFRSRRSHKTRTLRTHRSGGSA